MTDDKQPSGTVVDLATVRGRSVRDGGEKLFDIAHRFFESGDHEYLLQIAEDDGDAEFGRLMVAYLRTAAFQSACIDAVVQAGRAEEAIAYIETEIAEMEAARPAAVVHPFNTSTGGREGL